MAAVMEALTTAGRSIRAVAREPNVRYLELGWLLGTAGNWAFIVVALVVAYHVGGAAAVGLFGLVRMLPTIPAAPIASSMVGRFRGERVLLAAQVVRAVASFAVAAVLLADGPATVVFLAGAVIATATAVVRPIQAALMPAIVSSPAQLVASNVASSTAEGLAVLGGPALGGLLIHAVGAGPALVAVGGLFVAGAAANARIRVVRERRPGAVDAPGVVAQLRAGARTLVDRPGATVVVGGIVAQTFVRGLLTTLQVVAAIELLGLGNGGVGALTAAFGLGGLVGGISSAGLASRRRLAPWFAVALSGWGLPIAVIGLVATPTAAFGAMALIGLANATLDVTGYTLIQRNVPNAQRAAVFGLLEGSFGISVAAGAGLAPILVAAFGIEGALAVTGAILPILAVAGWPRISRTDRDAVVPETEMQLLRGVGMLAPLPLTVVEQLAGAMTPVSYAAGETIMREGEPGDSFVIIRSGRVRVSRAGAELRTLGPGAGLGEIAVLRRVPRTATVVAEEPVEAIALACTDFVAAVTGSPASLAAADNLIDDRLGAGPAA